jgi:hypothetical protein
MLYNCNICSYIFDMVTYFCFHRILDLLAFAFLREGFIFAIPLKMKAPYRYDKVLAFQENLGFQKSKFLLFIVCRILLYWFRVMLR